MSSILKTRKTVKSLACELTEAEYTQRSERLVAVMGEIRDKEKEKKQVAKAYSEEIARLQHSVDELSDVLHNRREYRDVPCTVVTDRDKGVERLIRNDTGEQVNERKLTEDELQEKIEFADLPGRPAAGGAGDGAEA